MPPRKKTKKKEDSIGMTISAVVLAVIILLILFFARIPSHNSAGNQNDESPSPLPEVSLIEKIEISQPNYCQFDPAASIGWTLSDSSSQFAYQVQVADEIGFNKPIFDSSKVVCSLCQSTFTGMGKLDYNKEYWARVKIWDEARTDSGWFVSEKWATPPHKYPVADFDWQGKVLATGEQIKFSNNTACLNSEGEESDCKAWEWRFGDGDISISKEPIHTFISSGEHNVKLYARDNDNFMCYSEEVLKIKSTLGLKSN